MDTQQGYAGADIGRLEERLAQTGRRIELLERALEQIKELETLEDGALSTSGDIAARALNGVRAAQGVA